MSGANETAKAVQTLLSLAQNNLSKRYGPSVAESASKVNEDEQVVKRLAEERGISEQQAWKVAAVEAKVSW